MEDNYSIFTIERRKNFGLAFSRFFEDLKSEVVISTGSRIVMFDYLNYCLRYWPYRYGATSLDAYLKEIGVDITNPKNDRDLLLILELLINLLYWAPKQDRHDGYSGEFSFSLKKNDVQDETERLIENAQYLLEQCCNMTVREEADEECPKYHITKRNVHVDSAVLATPELKDVLLGYLDIRNSDDVEYKMSCLTKIYMYLEPIRNELKGQSCCSISEEFFMSMNTFGIRHNKQSQIKLTPKNKKKVCDKLFSMAVYVLQTSEVSTFKNELKEMRNNQKILLSK